MTSTFQKVTAVGNLVIRPLVASPRWGRFVDRWMTVITYTGRRSGRTFTIPIGYRRAGDELKIVVILPDQKSWWRNFTGEGAPILIRLGGVDRPGHGVARRDNGRVVVSVRLDGT